MKKVKLTIGMTIVALIVSIIIGGPFQTSQGKEKTAIRVLVWSEGSAPKDVYPNDINGAIAEHLGKVKGLTVKTANLSDPDQGLSQAALDNTDVLFWWGHRYHNKVNQEVGDRIVKRVKEGGMGFVAVHSAHHSQPFKALLSATGNLTAKNEGTPEHIHVVTASHPIAKGVKDFTIPKEEEYLEPFDVPQPETLVFRSKWDNGHEFRSGCVWTAGKGKVFYFRPGHESYPTMHQPEVVKILTHAAFWAGSKNGKEARP